MEQEQEREQELEQEQEREREQELEQEREQELEQERELELEQELEREQELELEQEREQELMKENYGMKFFKAEDFADIYKDIYKDGYKSHGAGDMWEPETRPDDIANLCNAKLMKLGKVVYTESKESAWQPWHNVSFQGQTHKALLINIEPVAPCTHPAEKVTVDVTSYSVGFKHYWQCECGARVFPNSFSEVKE